MDNYFDYHPFMCSKNEHTNDYLVTYGKVCIKDSVKEIYSKKGFANSNIVDSAPLDYDFPFFRKFKIVS